MKKKSFVLPKDREEWEIFTKNMYDVVDKETNLISKNLTKSETKKLDLHGSTLNEANLLVEKFIIESFHKGYKKLIIVTGKGSRSKSYANPYLSKRLSTLKYSIPEYIERNKNLSKKIIKIVPAEIKDGGEGAFYIFLKKV